MTDTRRTVLLVEDDPRVRDVLGRMLRAVGFDAHTASTSEEALALLRGETRFDLVVTDLRLRSANGLQIATHAMAGGSAALVISGFATPEDEETILATGAHLLRKPFNVSTLEAAVAEVLGPPGAAS